MCSQMNVTIRRNSNPYIVKHVYAAIQSINNSLQGANFTQICKYMQLHHSLPVDDCIAQLRWCVNEGVLHLVELVGENDLKEGKNEDRYVIPRNERDGHDWFCFECHMSGPVIDCSCCHRVFHIKCFKGIRADKILCYICECQNDSSKMPREKLNSLLGYLCKNIEELVPDPLKNWKILESEEVIVNALIYKQMDWCTIQNRISNLEYFHLQEFRADVQNFLHNVIIFYGDSDPFTKQVKIMFDSCDCNIKDIEMCADCYEASNAKEDEHWFCKPCTPPHKLIFAKIDTYSYWPAKLIGENDGAYEIRFFGTYHTRALIPKINVLALDPKLQELEKWADSPVRASAYRELMAHNILLGSPLEMVPLPEKDTIQMTHSENKRSRRVLKRKRDMGKQKSGCALQISTDVSSVSNKQQTGAKTRQQTKQMIICNDSSVDQEDQGTNGNGLNQVSTQEEPPKGSETKPEIKSESHIYEDDSWLRNNEGFVSRAEAKRMRDRAVAEAKKRNELTYRRLKAEYARKLMDLKKIVKEKEAILRYVKGDLSFNGIEDVASQPTGNDTRPRILQNASFHFITTKNGIYFL